MVRDKTGRTFDHSKWCFYTFSVGFPNVSSLTLIFFFWYSFYDAKLFGNITAGCWSLRFHYIYIYKIYTHTCTYIYYIYIHAYMNMYIYIISPQWLSSKESTCKSIGDVVLITGSGRSPGGGHVIHSSILAWRMHGQRSLVGYSP